MTSMIGLTFLLHGSVLAVITLQLLPLLHPLRWLIPSSSLIRCLSVQVSPASFFSCQGRQNFWVVSVPTSLALKLLVISFYVWVMASSLKMPQHSFFKSSWKTQLLVWWPPTPWYDSGLAETFFLLSIFLFPRCSCCFRPLFLMPLLHFYCARSLFSNFGPLRVLCTKLSLICFFNRLFLNIGVLWPHTLPRAGTAWWVNCPQAAANFCQDHHHPGSVSSAAGGTLRLDYGPHICPPVLR
jgi:hypothetical protein